MTGFPSSLFGRGNELVRSALICATLLRMVEEHYFFRMAGCNVASGMINTCCHYIEHVKYTTAEFTSGSLNH